MRLDVVVPTYNRSGLLARALESLATATRPPDCDVHVVVADNNSTDDTREVVERMRARFGDRLHYVLARTQGSSAARNAGIRLTRGDVVAFIDDDETVRHDWLSTITEAFADPTLDFVGGPYLADTALERPSWVPPGYPAVIGVVDGGSEIRAYGADYPGVLMGGNAAIRRSVLERVGPYDEDLGRKADGRGTGEDHDLFLRLLSAGARGLYLPTLIIYHHIPPQRLTKRYYRRWCFSHGASMGAMDRHHREPVSYVLGIPRYRLGEVAREGAGCARRWLQRQRNRGLDFAAELKVWTLAGFAYGKVLRRGQ